MWENIRAAIKEFGVLEIWSFSEDGGPLIRCHPNGTIELWDVPQYGGEPKFCDYFDTINAAIEEARRYT
jgi:hypothetical protein